MLTLKYEMVYCYAPVTIEIRTTQELTYAIGRANAEAARSTVKLTDETTGQELYGMEGVMQAHRLLATTK